MNRVKNKGFSLIEAMVAAGLLATATVTICALGAKSLSALRVHQEYEKAWDILDRQMTLFEQIGIQTLAGSPNLSGIIKDQQSDQEWKWQIVVEPLETERLYSLSMTVEWISENKVRKIQCDTRLRAASDVISSTTSSTSSSGSSSSTGSTSSGGGTMSGGGAR